jgi:hypothetical protein
MVPGSKSFGKHSWVTFNFAFNGDKIKWCNVSCQKDIARARKYKIVKRVLGDKRVSRVFYQYHALFVFFYLICYIKKFNFLHVINKETCITNENLMTKVLNFAFIFH